MVEENKFRIEEEELIIDVDESRVKITRGKEGMTQESIPLEKITYVKTASMESSSRLLGVFAVIVGIAIFGVGYRYPLQGLEYVAAVLIIAGLILIFTVKKASKIEIHTVSDTITINTKASRKDIQNFVDKIFTLKKNINP